MSDTVIKVESLGKRYRIGANGAGTDGLRHVIHDFFAAPARTLRRNGHASTQDSGLSTQHSNAEEFWALKDVSFEVKRGEVVGIIGRNGAGKSTLLKILSRITEPTTGRLGIKGRVASLLEVGTGFHPELTGRENIYLNGAILGMSREEIKRKFDEIVAFAEIEKFIDTPVKRYSSGMYVRLAFAVAAHLEPEILIVDEVLSVGDLQFQKKCLGKMDEVARGGRTVLFVSHNMGAISRLCNKGMLLSAGRLVAIGKTHDVIDAYLQDSVQTRAVVELADSLHMIQSPLQVRTIEVLNSKRQPAEVLYFGEDIHVRVGVEARQTLPPARLGIGLHAEGVRLATFLAEPFQFDASPTLHSFVCSIPGSRLLPNFYTLHVGAYSLETGNGLDWVPDAISFRVEHVAHEGMYQHDEHETGFLTIDVSWTNHTSNINQARGSSILV